MVLEQVKLLATERHDRKTLAIDSITKLFANEIARESERLTDAGKKNEFGASKKGPVLSTICANLLNWVTRADMNAIFICQPEKWLNGARTTRENRASHRNDI